MSTAAPAPAAVAAPPRHMPMDPRARTHAHASSASASSGSRPSPASASSGSRPSPASSSSSLSSSAHRRPHGSSSSSSSSGSKHKHASSSSSSSRKPGHSSSSSHRSSSSSSSSSSTPAKPSTEAAIDKRRSRFVHFPEYQARVTLPVIEPRLLDLPLSDDHLLAYAGGSIDKVWLHPLPIDTLKAYPIDLVDIDQYLRPAAVKPNEFDIADLPLLPNPHRTKSILSGGRLEEDTVSKGTAGLWLRKPEYLTPITIDESQSSAARHTTESSSSSSSSADLHATLEGSREARYSRVEQTFIDAKKPPVHAKDPSLTAESVLEIFPEDHLDNIYAWVEFDYDPLTGDSSTLPDRESISADNAVLIEIDDAEQRVQQHFSLYTRGSVELDFADAKTPVEPRDGLEEEFKWTRDYNTVPTVPLDEENNYVFMMHDDRVLYSRFRQRMKIAKRARSVESQALRAAMRKRPRSVVVQWTNEAFVEEAEADDDEDREGEGGMGDEGEGEGEDETRRGDDEGRDMQDEDDGEAY